MSAGLDNALWKDRLAEVFKNLVQPPSTKSAVLQYLFLVILD